MRPLLDVTHVSPAGTIKFREFAPCAALRSHVACIWTNYGSTTPPHYTYPGLVLPDGCTDIIFQLSSHSPGAVVIGPMRRPRSVISSSTHALGVRFYPGAAPLFLGATLIGLQERVVSLSALCGVQVTQLLDRLLAVHRLKDVITVVETWLCAQLRHRATSDPHITRALQWTYSERGRLSVRELSQTVGLCERQLTRKFPAWTGYTPKQLVRLMRFQHALQALLHSAPAYDADIAARHGYADQSHMIRDFVEFSGHSPGALRRLILKPHRECPIFSIPTPGTLAYHFA